MTWSCKYCGQPNFMDKTHCSRCGRARGKDVLNKSISFFEWCEFSIV